MRNQVSWAQADGVRGWPCRPLAVRALDSLSLGGGCGQSCPLAQCPGADGGVTLPSSAGSWPRPLKDTAPVLTAPPSPSPIRGTFLPSSL